MSKRAQQRRGKRNLGSSDKVTTCGMHDKLPLALFKVEKATSKPQTGMTWQIDNAVLKVKGRVVLAFDSRPDDTYYVLVEVEEANKPTQQ